MCLPGWRWSSRGDADADDVGRRHGWRDLYRRRQKIGAGRRADANALALHALAIAVIFGLFFMLAMLGGGRWLYAALRERGFARGGADLLQRDFLQA